MFNSQKRYFKKKLKAIQCQIWDYEFKRFKTAELREDVRKEYDAAKSRLEVLKTQINAELQDGRAFDSKTHELTDEHKRLNDQRDLLEKDIKKMEGQIDSLDEEINGAKPSESNPQGVNGITQIIDSLRELREMVKDYLKQV